MIVNGSISVSILNSSSSQGLILILILTTVDGRNPAPVEVGSLSNDLQGFIHPGWCRISSINRMSDNCVYINLSCLQAEG